jgi:hypothetical protein
MYYYRDHINNKLNMDNCITALEETLVGVTFSQEEQNVVGVITEDHERYFGPFSIPPAF